MPRKWSVSIGFPVSVILFVLTAFTGSAAPAATITVNTTAAFISTDGKCSLREAIIAANSDTAYNDCPAGTTGIDNIVFDLGTGTPTINVNGSPLSEITHSVTINGNTGGATRVELNGAGAGANAHGLTISAGKTTIRGLVINRFSGNGIEIVGSSFNVIAGNLIGTNAAGTADLGNTGVGIHINTGTKHVIGGTSAADRNIISGNDSHGIHIDDAADTNSPPTSITITGNYIGTDINGTTALGNTGRGILILKGSGNNIGGTTGISPSGACTGACNLISGNGSSGVTLAKSENNNVSGNWIGTDLAGTADLGNGGFGILLSETKTTTIGGTITGARNLVSSNNDSGIVIVLGLANVVAGNLIGTNTTGTAALANSGAGIELDRTFNNTIGGTTQAERNVVSGNLEDGIWLGATTSQTPSHDNTILGNFIGVRLGGIGSLANGQDGIDISKGTHNTIGGTTGTTPGGACTGACNVISGNTLYGIRIRDGASDTTIQGNFIGINADGESTGGGNLVSGIGIFDTSHDNLIGGTSPSARNLISANGENGIEIDGADAANNVVQGNFIGTMTGGTFVRANGANGVFVRGPNNTIGGTQAGAGNLISANHEDGILIQGQGSTGNRVQGNYIGTTVTGTSALPNGENGIEFKDDQPSGNQIGGDFSDTSPLGANIIAFNIESGVKIIGGNENVVRFNSIFANATPELDLSFGNNDQAAPVLTSATSGSTHVQGTLTSTPSTDFVLDFYFSPDCAHPQGKTYLGSEPVTTNGAGTVNFTSHQTTSAPVGSFITATATDENNNTSEFSNCLQVVQGPTSTPTRTPTTGPSPTQTRTPTATPTTGCTSKPAKPILKAPANGALLATNRPKLKWNAAACASTYTLIVKDTATGHTVDKRVGLIKLKAKTKPLPLSSTDKWFVKACNTFGCAKSAKRTFSIP